MKRILSAFGVVMLALTFPLLSRTKAARTLQSYPLICRGAPSLEIVAAASDSWDVGFTFTRGTKPAGEGLAPGECSWVDRAMRADEPNRLYQNV
jgi:hypothetical protein